jgi:hypothetical protein
MLVFAGGPRASLSRLRQRSDSSPTSRYGRRGASAFRGSEEPLAVTTACQARLGDRGRFLLLRPGDLDLRYAIHMADAVWLLRRPPDWPDAYSREWRRIADCLSARASVRPTARSWCTRNSDRRDRAGEIVAAPPRRRYLLGGILACGSCGERLVASSKPSCPPLRVRG